MNIYIAVPPGTVPPAGYSPAHMIYRVRGARLYLSRGRRDERGGVAVISLGAQTGGASLPSLAYDIAAQCRERAFDGVVLDTGGASASVFARLASDIAAAIAPRPLFVPEALGKQVQSASVLIQTALSGGYLRRHLEDAVSAFGRGRVAAEVDRVIMDFPLPAYRGTGESISGQQAEKLRGGRPAHFSAPLCVNYFTFREGDSRHFVLFDDAESVSRKLALASSLGIGNAFLYYPHVSDILHSIRFPRG